MDIMDISVVIPVYNDPSGIQKTLYSLLKANCDLDREIIVVDNNSEDSTQETAIDILENIPDGYVIEENTIQSSYAARNAGIEASQGRIISFIDANVRVERDFISKVKTVFDRTDADYVGYNVHVYTPNNCDSFIARYNKAVGFPIESYIVDGNFAPTCGMAVRRKVIDEIGGFDDSTISGGDAEFGQRVATAGYKQYFARDIEVYHPARTSFSEMKSKAFRVGRGKEQLGKRLHPYDFLPPNPIQFLGHVPRNTPYHLLVLFYLHKYLYKMMVLLARFQERYNTRNRSDQ